MLDDTSSPNRRELEATAAALVELQERKKACPLYFFEPNAKLRGFHNRQTPVTMLAGGNRSGKTEHLAAEGAAQGLGYRPWVLREHNIRLPDLPYIRPDCLPRDAICFDGAGVRIRVPNTILLGTGLDLKKGIGQVLHPKIMSHLGPEGGPIVKKVYWGHANTPTKVVLHNGSEIHYASAEQKGLAWEGTNYSWYGLDEPVPKRIYSGVRRGAIDQAARITFSFTPLGPNAAWMFHDLYKNADGRRISVHNISIFDNPWLPPEAVEEFANDPSISDVEKEARLYGRFLNLVDRIYPQFDEDVHIIPSLRPDPSWFIGQVTDPHTVKPWALAWFCVTPSGDIIFFREWPASDFTKIRRDTRSAKEYAMLIREIEGDRPADYRLIDPNYGPRRDMVRGVSVPSVKDIFAEYGMVAHHNISDDLAYGESRVRALLTYNTNIPLSATNRPRLYVTEDCPNIINSFLYYIAKNKSAEDDLPDELKREETYKDFADVVRYAAVSRAAEHTLSDSWLNENLFSTFAVDGDIPEYSGYGEP